MPGKSVLLIDDCQNHAFFIERAFGKAFPGTAFHHLTDGERAVDHLDHCGHDRPMPDIVLLDRQMPGGMDGFETLAKLRERPHLADLAVLIVTGSDDPEHVERARLVGADGYAVKPPEQSGYAEFVRQIDAWTRARSWRSKEIVRVLCGPDVVSVPPVDSAAVSMTLAGCAERKMQEFFAACAYAGIEPRRALKITETDKFLDKKRRLVVRWLLTFPQPVPWGPIEVRDFLPFSLSYIEKRQLENDREPLPACGFRALALK